MENLRNLKQFDNTKRYVPWRASVKNETSREHVLLTNKIKYRETRLDQKGITIKIYFHVLQEKVNWLPTKSTKTSERNQFKGKFLNSKKNVQRKLPQYILSSPKLDFDHVLWIWLTNLSLFKPTV